MGDRASNRVQTGHFGLKGPFGTYRRWYHPYGISNTPQTIYFLNLLIETVILSYKTLKSNNFEKITYNENLNFEIDEGGFQNYFLDNFFFNLIF